MIIDFQSNFFLELIEPAGEIPVNSDAHAVDKRRKYLFKINFQFMSI